MLAVRDVWNPAVLLGITGTLGLLAARWSSARRWIAPASLAGLGLATWSWSAGDHGGVLRAAFLVSMTWGFLLTLRHWEHSWLDDGSVNSASNAAMSSDNGACRAVSSVNDLSLQFVMLAGLCGMAQARDLVTLFLGLEVATLGANVLRSSTGSSWWSLSRRFPVPWILLLGFVLLAAVTGSTRLETITEVLQSSYVHRDAARDAIAGGGSRLLTLVVVLVGTALAGYAVCVPFHFQFFGPTSASNRWGCSPTSAEVTEPASLLMPRAAALLGWVKLWPGGLTAAETSGQLLVGVLAACTGVVPLLQARREQRLVKQWLLLAMAQGGWLLLGVAAWSFEKRVARNNGVLPLVEWNLPTAAQAAWWLLLTDGVALLGLFGVLTYLRRRERPVEFVDDLRGLRDFEPIAAACASVCLLSLAGLPLLVGFWSRTFLALAAMNVRGEWGPPHVLVPHSGLLLLTAWLALCAVWSVSIALRSVWTMLFGLPLGQPRSRGHMGPLFSAVFAAVMVIGCGVLPGPLLTWLCAPPNAPPWPINLDSGQWAHAQPSEEQLLGDGHGTRNAQ